LLGDERLVEADHAIGWRLASLTAVGLLVALGGVVALRYTHSSDHRAACHSYELALTRAYSDPRAPTDGLPPKVAEKIRRDWDAHQRAVADINTDQRFADVEDSLAQGYDSLAQGYAAIDAIANDQVISQKRIAESHAWQTWVTKVIPQLMTERGC